MNFLKLYIGDYLRDTGTLTVAEHGAYLLMLLHVYATERPLPQGRELHRLLRAETKADRDAIDSVASRFWYVTPGGLLNKRADLEMVKANHQREVNRSVGKLGGRPKRIETESVIESGAEPEPNRNPNHSQTPERISKASPSHPPGGGLPAGFAEFWMAWPKNDRKQDKAKCAQLWRDKRLAEVAPAILDDVRVKRGTEKWQGGFVEAPLVYLRGRRWEDGVTPEAEDLTPDNPDVARTAELLRQQAERARDAVPPPREVLAALRNAIVRVA